MKMLTLANDSSYYLLQLADLNAESEKQIPIVKENSEALRQIVTWIESFLSNPHPQLGRTGDVCPYTKSSMKKEYLWLTVCRGKALSVEDVYTRVLKYRDWFLEITPSNEKESLFKTIIMIFPDIELEDVPRIIDVVQQQLKPKFVAEGLMIGQFHPHCPEPGLHNLDFRPLQAPVPSLVMRHMVRSDFPFLEKDEKFISSYINVFGNTIPSKIQEKIKETRFQVPL
jgi:hypothetical protein